jgi:hypothetical protein
VIVRVDATSTAAARVVAVVVRALSAAARAVAAGEILAERSS